MSLLPFFYGYQPSYYRSPFRHNDWDLFGVGVTPDEIQALVEFPNLRISDKRSPSSSFSPATIGKDGFQACVDVKQFQPNEISVKTVDNSIIVEGKHEERQDEHGCISRHFVRKYTLPKDYDPNQVVSTLSSDGVLVIKAPPPQKAIESNERVVQIQQTGPAHLNVKENPSEEKSSDAKEKK